MPCICCGREGVPLKPIPAHVGNLRACDSCISKHGAEKLGAEADRLLTDWFMSQLPAPECPICGSPLLVRSDGTIPAWCQKCDAKRKAYVDAQARRI